MFLGISFNPIFMAEGRESNLWHSRYSYEAEALVRVQWTMMAMGEPRVEAGLVFLASWNHALF